MLLNDEIWSLITSKQVDEVFPVLIKKYSNALINELPDSGALENFYKLFVGYIDALPYEKKITLLYNIIETGKNEKLVLKLSGIIQELTLFDFEESMNLLQNSDFNVQKRGLRVATYDKSFYNENDKQDLLTVRDFIKGNFPERGTRTMKKQLLSSKEKEIWVCECGKNNDIGEYCSGCGNDIQGFKNNELKPNAVESYLSQKIELISEFLK